ncbi:MAG: metallophosphoesterase, partial [Atribacterota bacterium]
MKSFAVISDLHLGNGSLADDFLHEGYYKKTNEEKFIEYLKLELEKYDMVILNGDVYELWQFSKEDINLAYPKLTELLRNCEKIKIIKGNHDWNINAEKNYDLNIKNASIKLKQKHDCICNVRLKEADIHIEHGHKNDPSMTSTFNIIMNWLFGWIERIIPPFDSWVTQGSDKELFENVEK